MVAKRETGTQEAFDGDTLIGKVVNGRFQVSERIARGGMANVYFATQTPLNRPVALKVLHGVRGFEAESEGSFRGRFLQEASILAKLQHPNIVVLLDYGQIADAPGEQYFIAMEYLRGETLAQRLRAHGKLSIEESLRLTRQIGRGLREAHRAGFVHRDLKPSNIILVPEDEHNYIVKLVDFGVGKSIGSPTEASREPEDATRAGLLLGSPRYMSPEQIRSQPIELATDLYALGVILFQALTGRLPFEQRNEVDLLLAHCTSPAPTLCEVIGEGAVPESLNRLVAGMLKKRPTERPSVEEFLDELALIEDELFGSVALAGPTLQTLAVPFGPKVLDATEATSPRSSSWRTRRNSEPPTTLTPVPPAPGETPRTHALRKFVPLLLALLALPLLAWLALRPTATEPSAALQSASPSRAAPLALVEPSAQTAVRPSFELTIDSVPDRALVSENGFVLGRTPLSVIVERGSVAAGPRTFVLQRAGYAPYKVEQRDSDAPVSLTVKLSPVSTRERDSHASTRKAAPDAPPRVDSVEPAASAPIAVPASKRADAGGLDIRLRR